MSYMRPSSFCLMEHCWFCVLLGLDTRDYLPLSHTHRDFNDSSKSLVSVMTVRVCWFCRFYIMVSCLTSRTMEACFRRSCHDFEFSGQSSPAGTGALVNQKVSNLNKAPINSTGSESISRKDFPADFKFGCATSALQTEGSGTEGGRGPSTWDSYIQDSTPGIKFAVDSYHRYKEDVQLLKAMGVDTYRFSISWSRILPGGTIDEGINKEGINFYNNFINDLIANGITPFATLFHFDLPTTLDTKYNGFLSIVIVDDFKAYADLCFKTFGDRVKHWATINEPQVWGQYGFTNPDPNANAATDPFLSAHHVLLAHAAAAKLYKNTYQPSQGGEIGIPLVVEWFEPFEDTMPDKAAARRAFDFLVGWFMEPLLYGDYPLIMKALVKGGLPNFTNEEKELVKGSYDYIGVNYYTSRFAAPIAIVDDEEISDFDQFQHVNITVDGPDGEPIGTPTPGSSEIYVYPQGLKKALILLKEYGNPKF
ncbi:cyanogenic beta-glucosidase-like [Argentina anserina]|uniref:cyanogenic beta-glucosidase-like n=1 Tax=Argentina anserina TaxID=57926 RepID=UPI0021766012|nr:cyanogenic beta-glucosidase-like [Potentilla anserina]XP_050382055.1 cyanogenic beta-glucosidase-like [Potentilla anserina]